MKRGEINEKVSNCIRQVAEQQTIELEKIEQYHAVVDDLGFKSLDVATLTALLEMTFHIDPFSTGMGAITDIRTVADICSLYERCLNGIGNQSDAIEVETFERSRRQKRLAVR